jgi:heptosyltransferase-2
LPATHQQGYVAFAIGGQHATKKLPFERMTELCQRIGQPMVLLGGAEDTDTAQRLIAALPKAPLYNACGRYNLNQSASLVRQATQVYTHDTGLMHIAAAFKKPIVSIWGNTVPAFGMYPYATDYVALEVKDLACRPCSKIGHDRCPKGHFKCMNELVFE